MRNLFKVKNKDTITTPRDFVSLLLTLRTDITHCSDISAVNFEQVNAGWDKRSLLQFSEVSLRDIF